MIQSFRHKGLADFFHLGTHRGIPAPFAARIQRLLDRLESSVTPQDMDLPGYRFHQLKGQRGRDICRCNLRELAAYFSVFRRGRRQCGFGGLSLVKSLRNAQRKPTHPGALLREDILPALKMTQTELAELLGVSRLTVSELINEKRAMSPTMALRIATLLNTSAESWLLMQQALDLWEVRQDTTAVRNVRPLSPSRLAGLPMQGET